MPLITTLIFLLCSGPLPPHCWILSPPQGKTPSPGRKQEKTQGVNPSPPQGAAGALHCHRERHPTEGKDSSSSLLLSLSFDCFLLPEPSMTLVGTHCHVDKVYVSLQHVITHTLHAAARGVRCRHSQNVQRRITAVKGLDSKPFSRSLSTDYRWNRTGPRANSSTLSLSLSLCVCS